MTAGAGDPSPDIYTSKLLLGKVGQGCDFSRLTHVARNTLRVDASSNSHLFYCDVRLCRKGPAPPSLQAKHTLTCEPPFFSPSSRLTALCTRASDLEETMTLSPELTNSSASALPTPAALPVQLFSSGNHYLWHPRSSELSAQLSMGRGSLPLVEPVMTTLRVRPISAYTVRPEPCTCLCVDNPTFGGRRGAWPIKKRFWSLPTFVDGRTMLVLPKQTSKAV